jgi:two-component system, NtrC family, response regulator AtoC
VVQLLLLYYKVFPLSSESICLPDARSEDPRPSLMLAGTSALMVVLERAVAEIAPTDIPVLILGESGTGKEVIASEIHRLSRRCEGPFIKFNCSNMSFDWLLGAELQRGGRGQQNGTVLLDDVTQLDPAKQSLLLNLLPNVQSVLSGNSLSSRIVSTSTGDLAEEVRRGNFRDDLYFRLNGICLRIPALRERKEDIPHLFASFVNKHSTLLSRQQPRVKNSTMDLLLQHSWPGNVRELENVARRIVVLGDDELAIHDLALSANTKATVEIPSNGPQSTIPSLKQTARDASRKAERQLILQSLERTHWNRKRTARELQISYKALLYKLKQLDLNGGKSES